MESQSLEELSRDCAGQPFELGKIYYFAKNTNTKSLNPKYFIRGHY